VDLAAVKDAPPWELARGCVAATRNARGLVEDAELLSGAGRLARAYSLAGLAVEGVGKAGALAILAAMPKNLRARAPVGRMLDWHQLKLIAGQLTAALPFSALALAPRFVTLPLSEVAEILDDARAFAQDVDRLKQRGLYVDVDRSGHVRSRPRSPRPTSAASSTGRGGPPRPRMRCSTLARRDGSPTLRPRRSSTPVRWSARSARQDPPELQGLPRTCC
jgi:AbiV family abortive infection protein